MQATATTYTARSSNDSTDMVTPLLASPDKLTASIFAVFVHDTTSEGNSRVRQFCTLARKTSRAEFNAAKREYLQGIKPADTVPEDADEWKAFASAKVRMSEFAAIYTYVVDLGNNPDSLGYHAAVKQARAVLKEAGIGPNGMPKGEKNNGDDELALHKAATKAALKLPHSSVEQLNELIEEQKEVLRLEAYEKQADKRREAVSKAVTAALEKGDTFAFELALGILSSMGYDIDNIPQPMYEQATM